MALYRIGEDVPRIAASAWVADSAQVVGKVELGDDVGIWFGAVLRADTDPIRIGNGSNVQDGAVCHADPGYPLTLGENVTVGHQAMLHGCTVGDGSLIGIQAVLLNGARIGRYCLVGAGALVTQGKAFPDAMLIAGSPARAVRPLRPEEIERLKAGAVHYIENARRFRTELLQIA
jgi:carbonic anhydrase/acetyltransferase-like protein (isoleucine patch superfamily)